MVAVHAWFKNSGYTPFNDLETAKTEILSKYVAGQQKVFVDRMKGDLGIFYDNLIGKDGRIGAVLEQDLAQIFNDMSGEMFTGGTAVAEGADISYKACAAKINEYIQDGNNLSNIITQTQNLLYSMISQIAGIFNEVTKQKILEAAIEKRPIDFTQVSDGILDLYGAEASVQQVINNYNNILSRVENLEVWRSSTQKTATFKSQSGKKTRMKVSKAEQKTISLIGGLLSDTGGVVEELAEIIGLDKARAEGLLAISKVKSSGRTKIIEDSKIKEEQKRNKVPPINKNDITISVGDDKVFASVGLSVKVSQGTSNLKYHQIKIHDTSLQNLFNKATELMPNLDNYARNLAAGFPDSMKTPTLNAYSGDNLESSWSKLKQAAALVHIADYLSGIGGIGNNNIIIVYNRKPILIHDILTELVSNPNAVSVGGPGRPSIVKVHIGFWSPKDKTGVTRDAAINAYLNSAFAKTASVKIKLASLAGLGLT